VAIRASVEGLPEPGHAILRISDLDAAPEGLAISIQRQQGLIRISPTTAGGAPRRGCCPKGSSASAM